MIKKINLLYCFFAIMITASCDKVIDVDLKAIEPQYVIEGRVTDGFAPWTVNLSTTQKFDENEAFKGVSGAKVIITMNNKSVALNEVAKGLYESVPLKGMPGQTYYLSVNIHNKVFTAQSKMPEAAGYLNLYLHGDGYSTNRAKVTLIYEDISVVKNFYWFEAFINGNKTTGFNVYNDEFNDGMVISQSLVLENILINGTPQIKQGTELRVDMLCIDPSVYTYFYSLQNVNGLEYSGSAPTNPASNISNGGLGFFSAHTRKSKKIILP